MLWIALGIVFICIAIGLHKFKLYYLLVGYRSMTEEQKQDINLRGLSIYFAILSYFVALIFFVMAVLSFIGLKSLFSTFFIILIIVVVGGVLDSQRYIKTLTDEHSKPVKIAKYKYRQLIMLLCGVGVVIAIFIYLALKPISIEVMDETLEITGPYSNSIPITEIQQLSLASLDTLPKVESTISGSTSRGQLQGLFLLEDNKEALLYINEDVNQMISFIIYDEHIYLNLTTEEETISLYHKLQSTIKK